MEVFPNKSASNEFQKKQLLSGWIGPIKVDGAATAYEINSLRPSTYYEVEVTAVNNKGTSDAKSFIFVTGKGKIGLIVTMLDFTIHNYQCWFEIFSKAEKIDMSVLGFSIDSLFLPLNFFYSPFIMPHLCALCFLVCGSFGSAVCQFSCLSCFRLKFLVEVVFDEVEVQLIWNLVHMFPMILTF